MKRLMAVQRELEPVTADGKNPHFKSTYATLEAVTIEVKKVLNKNCLFLSQPVNGNEVHTKVFDGETGVVLLESKYPVISKDPTDPQKFAGGVTYARRVSLLSLFAIPVEDDDGNHSASTHTARPVGVAKPTPINNVVEAANKALGATENTTDIDFVLPYGKAKGKNATSAPTSDLEWFASTMRQALADPLKMKFQKSNEVLLEKTLAILTRRGINHSGADELPF